MPSKWTGRDIWGCFSCDWEAGGADKEGVRLQCTGWRRDLVEWGGRVRTQLDSSRSSWGLTENRGSVVLVSTSAPTLPLLLRTHHQGGLAYQQHACRPAVSSANTDWLPLAKSFGFLPCTVVTGHLLGCDRWLRNELITQTRLFLLNWHLDFCVAQCSSILHIFNNPYNRNIVPGCAIGQCPLGICVWNVDK